MGGDRAQGIWRPPEIERDRDGGTNHNGEAQRYPRGDADPETERDNRSEVAGRGTGSEMEARE